MWDADPQPPTWARTSGQAETRRGLMLAEAIREQRSWFRREDDGIRLGYRNILNLAQGSISLSLIHI